MKLLFVDPCCPKEYTTDSLKDTPMGGTEATCARLMRELKKQDTVNMCQMKRENEVVDSLGIQYVKYTTVVERPDAVITLRDGKTFRVMNAQYPDSTHYIWMHDVVAGAYKEHLAQTLVGFPTHFIVGSVWHKMQLSNEFPDQVANNTWKVSVVTNFLESYCVRTEESLQYDPYQLVFFSSPHKDLTNTLKLFTEVRKADGRYTLKVGNPGYCIANIDELPDGVTILGVLPHQEIINTVRKSLCLFYPNMIFPETFGLVYAEANAVGTPVLCHDIGAAREVVTTQQQVVDCKDVKLVIETLKSWSEGERPIVKSKEQYTIREAIKEWRKFLNPMRLIK